MVLTILCRIYVGVSDCKCLVRETESAYIEKKCHESQPHPLFIVNGKCYFLNTRVVISGSTTALLSLLTAASPGSLTSRERRQLAGCQPSLSSLHTTNVQLTWEKSPIWTPIGEMVIRLATTELFRISALDLFFI